ncbi:MAG: hypothetical protein CO073_02635, partial [Candidatus Komeilibacteria bacterium CG_4_9_14_0_8_um_filter_36_9]
SNNIFLTINFFVVIIEIELIIHNKLKLKIQKLKVNCPQYFASELARTTPATICVAFRASSDAGGKVKITI